jgi:FAD/FMN-containing dehydrogenase
MAGRLRARREARLLRVIDVETLAHRLRLALGECVSTDAADLADAREDRSGKVSATTPLAVVHARTIDDVQATLRFATEHRVPVVTRGAGTGLAGGAIAGEGEIVLSTLLMNRILEVNVDDELAVVEPGIINDELNAALAPQGLWFAPDPASKAISTVGGNIATNAGGLLCAKYGVTRESVLGLKVVLADGRLLTLGHRTVKGVTGLDLTALMIGSEGTLGVIVEATVKLRGLPLGPVSTIGAYFRTVEEAARASSVITASRLRPAAMELLDESALAGIGDYLGLDLAGKGAYLLVQTDGAAARRRPPQRCPSSSPSAARRSCPPTRQTASGCSRCAGRSTPRCRRVARFSSKTSPFRAASFPRCSRRSPRSNSVTASPSRPSRTRVTATCIPTSCSTAPRSRPRSGRRRTSCSWSASVSAAP